MQHLLTLAVNLRIKYCFVKQNVRKISGMPTLDAIIIGIVGKTWKLLQWVVCRLADFLDEKGCSLSTCKTRDMVAKEEDTPDP